jgi:hypothetical protein
LNLTFLHRFLLNFISLALVAYVPVAPVHADEPLQKTSPEQTPSGIALSSRGQEAGSYSLDVWKFEHEKIRQIRANRHQPTERGFWYSSRSREEKQGRWISDAQFPLVATEIAYLVAAGKDGRAAAWNGVQALAVTGAITLSVKKGFRRRRPYPNDDLFGTFPSGHTSTTFAMAGVLGAAEPRMRVPALLAAGMVGWSRVKVRAHHWQDVFAGAALGLVVANQFKPDKRVNGSLANLNLRF